jgi:hypothetical protein
MALWIFDEGAHAGGLSIHIWGVFWILIDSLTGPAFPHFLISALKILCFRNFLSLANVCPSRILRTPGLGGRAEFPISVWLNFLVSPVIKYLNAMLDSWVGTHNAQVLLTSAAA